MYAQKSTKILSYLFVGDFVSNHRRNGDWVLNSKCTHQRRNNSEHLN